MRRKYAVNFRTYRILVNRFSSPPASPKRSRLLQYSTVQAQRQPQHADCAETKVKAKPKKNSRVKRPAFQLNPAIHQSKKR